MLIHEKQCLMPILILWENHKYVHGNLTKLIWLPLSKRHHIIGALFNRIGHVAKMPFLGVAPYPFFRLWETLTNV